MDNVVAGHNPGTTSLLKQQGPTEKTRMSCSNGVMSAKDNVSADREGRRIQQESGKERERGRCGWSEGGGVMCAF